MTEPSCKVTIHPGGLVITASRIETLKDALARSGYFFPQNCGGKGQCGHCRVNYLENPPSLLTREIEIFGADSSQRLACFHRVSSDCKVEILASYDGFSEKRLSGLASLRSAQRWLGIAVDIGTTVVALYVVDFLRGEVIHQHSFLNPQVRFGGDVMTRLELAKEPLGCRELTESIRNGLKNSIQKIADYYGFDHTVFNSVFIVGNTTMTHFLCGRGGEGLEKAPFRSPFENTGLIPFASEHLGLDAEVKCNIAPIIQGFIGSDITAGIIATDLDQCSENKLLIDLGTNGEIVLAARGELWATSTAAGPAFEGVGLHSGMPALKGAIEGFDDRAEPFVIGGGVPMGICGSGYIAALSRMSSQGAMDTTGLITKDQQGIRRWFPRADHYNQIRIVQSDVRKFQLAKGAIAAGINIICAEAGIHACDLDEIIITGSFGNRIDPAATIEVGLIPKIPMDRIKIVDNAAGRGALLCLVDDNNKRRAIDLQSRVKIVNLGGHPDFQDAFVANMYFPQHK